MTDDVTQATISPFNAPWSLRFERDGTEDVAVICDADDSELVRSRHFWLPEGDDPMPPTLAAVRLIQAAPALPFSQLTWFERNGGQAGVLGQPGYISSFSISPDGKRVALARNASSNRLAGSDIWLHELQRGTESRFTFKGLHNNLPVWSPDGSRFVYKVAGHGQWGIYQKPTNGTSQEELVAKGDNQLNPYSWHETAALSFCRTFQPPVWI